MDSLRKRLGRRLEQLKTARQPWESHWKELVENVRPRTGRFLLSDAERAGNKHHGKVINGSPLIAARTLNGGMMAGITSPSRPWFRLATPDPALSEVASVRDWLDQVEKRIREALAKSNIYNCLYSLFGELAVPGTGALFVEESGATDIVGTVFPIGSFYASGGPDGVVDTVFRTFQLTASNMARQFPPDRLSVSVRKLLEEGQLETKVQVAHALYPRLETRGEIGPESMPWASAWWEVESPEDSGVLREAGYWENPCMVPRWAVVGDDVYGSSPGMDALGDCLSLQHAEKRKAQIIDKITNPPMRGPSSLSSRKPSLLPGGVTYVDAIAPGATFAPAYEINPSALVAIRSEIQALEARIEQAFFADLWLMLSQSDGNMTAREVVERREEKLLQLSPVLERLNHELLDPLIDRLFGILLRRGELPEPPEELSGQPLKVEFISILAQAQKLLGTTQVERLVGFAGQVAQMAGPGVLDKLDLDQAVDEYSAMLGTPAALVRADEQVARMRAQRNQQAQQQAQLEQAQQVAQTAKTASETDTTSQNALTEMLRGMGAR